MARQPLAYYKYRIKSFPMDAWNEIKWAWQRVTRGWDDRAEWSIDWWLSQKMVEILTMYQMLNIGTPMNVICEMFPGYDPSSDEDVSAADVRWREIVHEIIVGFEAAQRISDHGDSPEQRQKFEHGMDLLKKYYFDLWD